MDSLFPASKARYSLTWAHSVVQEVRERYARGLEIVYDLLGINDEIMARYLARNDSMWVALRTLAKEASKPAYSRNEEEIKIDLVCYMRRTFAQETRERLYKGLTATKYRTILKELGISEGPEGGRSEAEPDRWTQPLLFEDMV